MSGEDPLKTDREMKLNLAYIEWNIEEYILKVHFEFSCHFGTL